MHFSCSGKCPQIFGASSKFGNVVSGNHPLPLLRKNPVLRPFGGVGEFAAGSVSDLPSVAISAYLPSIEGQTLQSSFQVLTFLNALFYMAASGVFRLHPASSGYCNIKCPLTRAGTVPPVIRGKRGYALAPARNRY